ncbi:MAG: isoprenylcysteine carboxylmethyltransferase family protein [Sulfurovum sp.]|nr:isoprenylcysteine carboxylmethyltransferase family protein [Sulfurovum sp.]
MKHPKLNPSALFLITFASGVFLTWIQPWHLTYYMDDAVVRLIGAVILCISLILNTLAYREFKKCLTPHAPFVKPTVLIKNGVFALSRNPVYLALVLSECGLAFVFNTLWLLFSATVLLIVLDTVIIRGEEKVLKSTFNNDYEYYKKQTRRWL